MLQIVDRAYLNDLFKDFGRRRAGVSTLCPRQEDFEGRAKAGWGAALGLLSEFMKEATVLEPDEEEDLPLPGADGASCPTTGGILGRGRKPAVRDSDTEGGSATGNRR